MDENFAYSIVRFDDVNKQIQVDFGTDGWALITLNSPLPKNRKELETIIAAYTKTIEQVRAKSESTDLSYINEMLGKSYTAARNSFTPLEPTSSPLPEGTDVLEDMEEEYFKNRVDERLRELGLIV